MHPGFSTLTTEAGEPERQQVPVQNTRTGSAKSRLVTDLPRNRQSDKLTQSSRNDHRFHFG